MPKYWGETNFHTREIPRSESKAKDGERKREDWTMVITMAKHGARKPPGGKKEDTPGTAGGPGSQPWPNAGREKKKKQPKFNFFFIKKKVTIFFLHISSSYAKILGEKLFLTWEIPRSGSKAEDGEKKREILQGLRVAQAAVT